MATYSNLEQVIFLYYSLMLPTSESCEKVVRYLQMVT